MTDECSHVWITIGGTGSLGCRWCEARIPYFAPDTQVAPSPPPPVAWRYRLAEVPEGEPVRWYLSRAEPHPGGRKFIAEPLYAAPLTRGLVGDPSSIPPGSAGSHTPTDISAPVAPDSLVARLRERAEKLYDGWTPGNAALALIAAEMSEAADRLERVTQALARSMVALDDWLNVYAPEHCNADRVAEARARIAEGGTLGYIAGLQAANRAALAEAPSPPPLPDLDAALRRSATLVAKGVPVAPDSLVARLRAFAVDQDGELRAALWESARTLEQLQREVADLIHDNTRIYQRETALLNENVALSNRLERVKQAADAMRDVFRDICTDQSAPTDPTIKAYDAIRAEKDS